MSSTLSKLGTILLYVLMGVSVVLAIVFYMDVSELPSDATREMEMEVLDSSVNLFLGWGAFLVGFSALATLVFAVVGWISQPKKAVRALISIALLAIVVLIAYFMADATPLNLPAYDGTGNTPEWNKFAGTGLISMYILLGLAVLSIFSSGLIKLIK